MLLALDVASSICTVALYDPAREIVLAEKVWRSRRRQTEETLPVAAEVLAQAGAVMDDVRALAVTTGPGSFTGVRIGISVVKGIALGLPRPPQLIGLPVLSAVAARFLPLAVPGAEVWPVLQAGRARFNWAAAPTDDPLWLPDVDEHRAGQVEALVAALRAEERPVWLVGDLSSALRQDLQGLAHVRCIDPAADHDLPEDFECTPGFSNGAGAERAGLTETRGEGLARLAMRHLRASSPACTAPLQPLYLRPPQ
ncbi:MAG: tRNA (adenosine(37)-N6)-threonylcarbamoyltransferase complex dimerization subunit type 1 TsaB [Caldilineaceae bacterium]|nr:tRNA (adenosine(37)-N6)-threonylcarbamoyltransferase complex dimerization subunit type 1 TsaB [Caldilineaceae bacterium]MDE0339938.1 tRNA (adenosine(37)-N6)-threonylcarbamoyltransferase complex dimerization subunit type 1 TsaB [Caldilineaceae bacterium]